MRSCINFRFTRQATYSFRSVRSSFFLFGNRFARNERKGILQSFWYLMDDGIMDTCIPYSNYLSIYLSKDLSHTDTRNSTERKQNHKNKKRNHMNKNRPKRNKSSKTFILQSHNLNSLRPLSRRASFLVVRNCVEELLCCHFASAPGANTSIVAYTVVYIATHNLLNAMTMVLPAGCSRVRIPILMIGRVWVIDSLHICTCSTV
jgi:hypothetical protein